LPCAQVHKCPCDTAAGSFAARDGRVEMHGAVDAGERRERS
jgi:hypothetical protein